jgi:hypothetical protein
MDKEFLPKTVAVAVELFPKKINCLDGDKPGRAEIGAR